MGKILRAPAKMRSLLLCLLLAAAATAWPHLLQDEPMLNDEEVDDLAHRQQVVNRLLYKVSENITFPGLRKCSQNFNPLARLDIYEDGGKAAKVLMQELKDHRLLKQHHWFSLFNERQRAEALMLFDILMACREFHCLRHNAAFFRERMNEGEFVYALYTTLYHSNLGKGIVLPPLYEVTPHMFTNSEVIQQAYKAQMTQIPGTLNMVEELYWDKLIVQGFAPHTTYRYGGEFPTRP